MVIEGGVPTQQPDDAAPVDESSLPGASKAQPIGEKPARDPTGPGYGTTPEQNPQMEPVDGMPNIYKSPDNQYYEYRPDTDQKWFVPEGLPNAANAPPNAIPA